MKSYTIVIKMHVYSAELTATKIIVTISFCCLTIENNIVIYTCFLLEGRSFRVCTGDPLTSEECNPVLSRVPSRRFEQPTNSEVLHEGAAFNTLR